MKIGLQFKKLQANSPYPLKFKPHNSIFTIQLQACSSGDNSFK